MLKARNIKKPDFYITDFLKKCDPAKSLHSVTHVYVESFSYGLSPGIYQYVPGGVVVDMDGDYAGRLNQRQIMELKTRKSVYTHQPTLDMQLANKNEDNV